MELGVAVAGESTAGEMWGSGRVGLKPRKKASKSKKFLVVCHEALPLVVTGTLADWDPISTGLRTFGL